jgi:uncharacterized protein
MPSQPLVARLYAHLLPRKIFLALTLTICLAAAFLCLRTLHLTENIEAMLPDDASRMSENFRLLRNAPLLSKVLVVLESGQASPDLLLAAVREVRTAAGPPWFKPPLTREFSLTAATGRLLETLPATLTEQDLLRIENMLSPDFVRHALLQARKSMAGLDGIGFKGLIRADPLGFRNLTLEKLSSLNLFGDVAAPVSNVPGAFLSEDQRRALIVLDTPVDMTDALSSREMLAHLEQLILSNVSDGIHHFVVSGHTYAAANVAAIQRDLAIVLAASTLGILVIFVCFLRTWQAMFVYLIPLGALLAGAAITAATHAIVSGITLGFGAVLMGLSVDYGLHVFYGLQSRVDPGQALARVTRPVLFCWLTTTGVFSLLLWSSLPGQRQLALFTVSGLSAALVLALIALPVFLPVGKETKIAWRLGRLPIPNRQWRILVLSAFIALVLASAICWPTIRFDGRLQALGMAPKDLTQAEQAIATSWGDVRGLAMIVSFGADLGQALQEAARVRDFLAQTAPGQRTVNLTTALPPFVDQQEAIRRWEAFWADRAWKLKREIVRQGAELGFSDQAFAPFLEYLAARPREFALDDLQTLGLSSLSDMLLTRHQDSLLIATLVPDRPEIHALFADIQDKGVLPASRLVSQELLGQELATVLHRDMSRFLIAAGVLVVVLVGLLFRNLRRTIQALTPALAGLSALVLVVTLLDIPFTLYSIAATFLVLGLGVDYGIFMASRSQNQEDLGTEQAVLVSGLTTLAGFGALILASHPALHSIGMTVLIGIAAAVPAALFVVPALEKQRPTQAQDGNATACR